MPDPHVALVNPLLANRALDIDHAVIEVDQHHAVGHDALASYRNMLVGGDRAFLAEDRLGTHRHPTLVGADLASLSQPRPASQRHDRVAANLKRHAPAHEAKPVGLQPATPAELEPQPAGDQRDVGPAQQAAPPGEAQECDRAATERCGRPAHEGRRHRVALRRRGRPPFRAPQGHGEIVVPLA